MVKLKPFWRYYGGKYRAAPRYPQPLHNTIIEPFAGAAGYSLRYYDRKVILVEKYPVIAELWRYLIGVSSEEVLRIPCVEHIDELPDWVPAGGRYLVGYCFADASVSPRGRISAGMKKLRERWPIHGWSERQRERVATQVPYIKHWQIIEGDYALAPDVEATWFVDSPYNNKAGRYYVCHGLDYSALGIWCQSRRGQVMVCEQQGADWLPFTELGVFKSGPAKGYSTEVIWSRP